MDITVASPSADEIGKQIALAIAGAEHVQCVIRQNDKVYRLSLVTLDEDEPPT
jgi:hypothetical protein